MKKTITKSVTEEAVFCDTCGKEIGCWNFSCIVCGRIACDSCLEKNKMAKLSVTEFPAFWSSLDSMQTIEMFACDTCSNSLTRRMERLISQLKKRNAQCLQWRAWTKSEMRQIIKEQEALERQQA